MSHNEDMRDSHEYFYTETSVCEQVFKGQDTLKFSLARSRLEVLKHCLIQHILKQFVYTWMSLKSEFWM